ncbi:pseudaminic acid cytidylyltransferase [Marinobacter daepoensis]|uniref:Pseudaminic acid cytidylyltransferase n=1 Tax=Marinobacter daepoensis TaxID=262077 RepID=A0ABS3BIH2_9GAMM|nr:pseudaminic acid cytidylyltransferase [Marinobacter daepoensis]MBN7771277.1 pseudaminic acid cytidylyltransferase [Marinobacter daepoensis]MBY6079139.1 pseudaminic acid cytidylyltransferase [Marinobacter daepoensis]
MTRLAIIPARGGSKRIPRKNIKEFCGKPMIAWSIDAARESGCFDHIIVSTDDPEIAAVAEAHGAEVPFTRPPELSDDHTATRPVINHAIQEATGLWGLPEYVCCLYATAPFVLAEDLQQAFAKLRDSNADFVFSAGRFPYPIKRGFRVNGEGRVERLWPEHRYTRSQDLEEAYHDAGQFYWGKTKAFLDFGDPMSEAGIAYVLPGTRVHDIDTQEDWAVAELLYRALNQR